MRWITVAALGIVPVVPSTAQPAYTLYDATLGSLPAAQPWLAYASNGSASQTYVSGQGVRLTTDAGASAGYSNYLPIGVLNNAAFPVLDRTAGFRLNWTARVQQESHSSADRAGFSTILLSSDRRGIEIGFWAIEVWVQGVGFTHAEGAAWNTSLTTDYALTIQGNTYQLNANGTSLLTGSLRDYSSSGPPVYNLSNFLFLGDNTTSASADVTLGTVTVVSPVPEPSGLLAVVTGFAGACVLVRNRLRSRSNGGGDEPIVHSFTSLHRV